VLMVTHDPRILDIADRVQRMEDGQLVESTTGERIRSAAKLPDAGMATAVE